MRDRAKNKTKKGQKPHLSSAEIEHRRQVGIEEYKRENPDHAIKNRKWSATTKREYQRQENAGKSRGKCRGRTVFGTDCPSNASPSGSGYCSWHEQQGVEVGEKVREARPCSDCGRNPAWAEGNTGWCKECLDRRASAGRRFITGEESPELDDSLDESEGIGRFKGESDSHYLDRMLTPNGVELPATAMMKELTPEEIAERKRLIKEANETRSNRPPSPLLKLLFDE